MYQQIIIVGNLGQDPEMRYTASGVPVTGFSVAVNKRWTNQEGQPQDKTTWFRITAWNKLAETTAQYLSKGRQVMIVGEVETPDVWTDRDGNHRASLEVTARDVRFLSGGDNMGSRGGVAQTAAPAGVSSGEATAPSSDEDIPF